MADDMGLKPCRITLHFRLTVLSRVEFWGGSEIAPQFIGSMSGDSVSHDKPPIQSQGAFNQRLAQGPGHHGGEPPGFARISQGKYGGRFLYDIPQP